MTKEEKDLLFKELCARVPYRVRCQAENGLGGGKTDRGVLKWIGNCNGVISNYYEDVPIDSGFINNVFYPIENIKPYLRPMSSMTEEESKDFALLQTDFYVDGFLYPTPAINMVNWLNAHHFDYMGLIEKGLALEAPEGMYFSQSISK